MVIRLFDTFQLVADVQVPLFGTQNTIFFNEYDSVSFLKANNLSGLRCEVFIRVREETRSVRQEGSEELLEATNAALQESRLPMQMTSSYLLSRHVPSSAEMVTTE